MDLQPNLITLISIALNAIGGFYWLKGKLITSLFLSGRWKGTLYPEGKEDRLECDLVVTNHRNRDNAAYFVYRCYDSNTTDVKYAGTDVLDSHIELHVLTTNKIWIAQFHRVCHQSTEKAEMSDIASETKYTYEGTPSHPAVYEWICTLEQIFTNPKLVVHIQGNGMKFSGTLEKH